MADTSKIEWTDATWNPLVGCTKVSPGCDHCYAETLVNRFAGHNKGFPNRFDVVTLREDRMLTQPLRWRTSKRIFVNSLSDLFHKDVPDEFIARVWAVMALAPQHQFQLLTKRHGRMRSLLSDSTWRYRVSTALDQVPVPRACAALVRDRTDRALAAGPLPNVWLGVSVEDQARADLRIPALLDTPAAVRWLSCEPLLGPVDVARWCEWPAGLPVGERRVIDWVVVGGESGGPARPMHPDWARHLRDQCAAAGVPFLFKQWGEWRPLREDDGRRPFRVLMEDGSDFDPAVHGYGPSTPPAVAVARVGKKAAGRVLDGVTHDGYPTEVDA